MPARFLVLMKLLTALLPLALVRAAQPVAPLAALPEELVLAGENIIEVLINGTPVRLEVTGEAFGAPVINSELAVRLQLLTEFRRGWQIGPVVVKGSGAVQSVDFGNGAVPVPVTWSDQRVSQRADGIIGVHHLPFQRVTFLLAPPSADEMVQRFLLKRTGNRDNARIGTEVTVGKRQLTMIFVPERADNLITAPTANFIATHQEGGFEPGSDGVAVMNFAIERPTRVMRIAYPIELGDLVIDRFAVRIEDYGDPKRVGEIGENDPRFEKGRIIVSRRKGRGRPDLLTRLGRDQIAHCSQITYDLDAGEIRLSCGRQED